jgi:cytochrome P450
VNDRQNDQPSALAAADKDQMLKSKDAFFGHGVVRDPYPRLAAMLGQCPVHPGAVPEYFGTIGPETVLYPGQRQFSTFSFKAVEEVFKDPRRFSACWYQASLRSTIGRTLLEMDPPEHTRYRRLIQVAFTRKEMERWEREFVRDIVDSFIDRFADRGSADLVADFALHYPLRVIVEAAGLPESEVDTFYRWAAFLTNVSIDEETRRQVAVDFGEYLQSVVDGRRADPGTDLVSLLVTSRFDDDGEEQRLTDEEVVAFLRLLIPAGAQTTYRQFCNLVFGLLSHPDQLAAVQRDPSLIPQAVEEGLRWQPPLISFGRTAIVDTEIEGIPIPAGSHVNAIVASADRDPARWDEPERFDIFRPPLAHLAFGSGPHICLGIHFARMELKVALQQLLARLPNLRLDPRADDVHIDGLGARSPDRLPVVFG